VGGDNQLSGDYRGLEQLQAMVGRFLEASGEYSFENHAYLADDEHGIVLQRGTRRRGDETFSTNEAFVVHFRDRVSWWLLLQGPVGRAGRRHSVSLTGWWRNAG
jgi:ketosteroid isomerase-like protein